MILKSAGLPLNISVDSIAIFCAVFLSDSIATISFAIASLGSNFSALEQQTRYLEILKDVTETGLGNIVDADMARASAKLTSSQVRKELAAQTLSIANQSPEVFLGLFESR